MAETHLEKQIFDMIVEKMELKDVVAELPQEKLSYDTPLFESMDPEGLALDSIAALELVVLLKEHFDVTVGDEDMAKLTTVNKIADFIRSSKQEAS